MFRCRRFREHGHLLREFPLNKKQESKNTKLQQDENDFVKPNHKSRGNKRQGKAPIGSNLESSLRIEGRCKPNQGEEGGKEKTKCKEASEHATQENTENPRNKGE
jgi:hypothetical protein